MYDDANSNKNEFIAAVSFAGNFHISSVQLAQCESTCLQCKRVHTHREMHMLTSLLVYRNLQKKYTKGERRRVRVGGSYTSHLIDLAEGQMWRQPRLFN